VTTETQKATKKDTGTEKKPRAVTAETAAAGERAAAEPKGPSGTEKNIKAAIAARSEGLAKSRAAAAAGDRAAVKEKAAKTAAKAKGSTTVSEPKRRVGIRSERVKGSNVVVRTREGARIATEGRGDKVALELAKCVTVDQIVELASEILPEKEVRERFKNAKNFGLFRMVIGNRIRGELARKAREKEKGAKAPAKRGAIKTVD
jgi:hypothetical protein